MKNNIYKNLFFITITIWIITGWFNYLDFNILESKLSDSQWNNAKLQEQVEALQAEVMIRNIAIAIKTNHWCHTQWLLNPLPSPYLDDCIDNAESALVLAEQSGKTNTDSYLIVREWYEHYD